MGGKSVTRLALSPFTLSQQAPESTAPPAVHRGSGAPLGRFTLIAGGPPAWPGDRCSCLILCQFHEVMKMLSCPLYW